MRKLEPAIEQALLREELEFYARHRHEWLAQHEGEFVLLGKGSFGGFHPSYETAQKAAIRAYGAVMPFLIRQVTKQ